MTNTWYAIISVVLVSLVSLAGLGAFALKPNALKLLILLSIGFAAGALFGDAFIHLIPESFGQMPAQTPYFILVGIFGFFILEKILHWHRHPGSDLSADIKPIGYLNLVADGLHNFIDGVLIGSSYLINTKIGIATTVAVVLHEIPQEIGDFGILLHAGFSKTKALFFNFLSAVFAILGAILAVLLGGMSADFALLMLPVAAGGFTYIAGSDLVPELQQEIVLSRSVAQIAALGAGVGLMLLLA